MPVYMTLEETIENVRVIGQELAGRLTSKLSDIRCEITIIKPIDGIFLYDDGKTWPFSPNA